MLSMNVLAGGDGRRTARLSLAVLGFAMLTACGPPPKVYWREMLGKYIRSTRVVH